ncbi:XrtA/PEP-CTERM system histidine kinase PrsK [Sphingosinicella microcystinivorans]|uniref:XrtA/PEP-CTERM system histidine kinase PrsK n=1 Tax=Sphingosinicella microcystinivorans TaxID=335406 RepID=UPI0022F385E8|nr:XrtA/PEP-CTERM system histidine kinase PrsK [Sphingosinicella microcystinivorans]WBX83078.1 PEP-CTERM system histidine kinase PrsK [Sphingosinicella microcystinivorans]
MPAESDVSAFSHSVAAIGYLLLAGLLIFRRPQSPADWWLVGASLATALWAVLVVLVPAVRPELTVLVSIAETLRSATWAIFAAVLVISNWQDTAHNPSRSVLIALAVVVALQMAGDVWSLARGAAVPEWLQYFFTMGRLAVAIGGLVLTHNVYVNSAPSNRWSIRLLCIALAGIFAYDLNLYTLFLLDRTMGPDLVEVRGLVNALVLPLIYLSAARNRGLRLQVSRQAAFHTLSLGAIGLYLVLMSLAGYGLRLVGGDWGRLLQISFIFAAAVLAAVILFSGRARAWLRVQINKHFFAYKYDYRQEWLRFVNTVSSSGPGLGALHVRVVQAACEPVDSPGGALFIAGEDDSFAHLARWNYRTLLPGHIEGAARLKAHFEASGRILDIEEHRAGTGAVRLPQWLIEDPQAWLLVPLIHIDEAIGFILIERPLTQRELNWEDFDILRTVGRQAASYVAEAAALAKIAESRKFDEFNRRFAFIMHDLKNLVSQLSLVARNAERHADNPEFRADMIATLQSSVAKMNDLLARLSQQSVQGGASADTFDVGHAVASVATAARRSWPEIAVEGDAETVTAKGAADRFEQVLTHLVQNAVDASAPGSPVTIAVEPGDIVRVHVRDRGRGMSADFIRDELFAPFKSTKSGGFGIGAFEAREMTREMGGKLLVESEPGVGSCFTIELPAAAARQEANRREG